MPVRIPQGSVLGLVLYLFYINDVPTTFYSTTATFSDDMTILTKAERDCRNLNLKIANNSNQNCHLD